MSDEGRRRLCSEEHINHSDVIHTGSRTVLVSRDAKALRSEAHCGIRLNSRARDQRTGSRAQIFLSNESDPDEALPKMWSPPPAVRRKGWGIESNDGLRNRQSEEFQTPDEALGRVTRPLASKRPSFELGNPCTPHRQSGGFWLAATRRLCEAERVGQSVEFKSPRTGKWFAGNLRQHGFSVDTLCDVEPL